MPSSSCSDIRRSKAPCAISASRSMMRSRLRRRSTSSRPRAEHGGSAQPGSRQQFARVRQETGPQIIRKRSWLRLALASEVQHRQESASGINHRSTSRFGAAGRDGPKPSVVVMMRRAITRHLRSAFTSQPPPVPSALYPTTAPNLPPSPSPNSAGTGCEALPCSCAGGSQQY